MRISVKVREAAINCLVDFYPIWKAHPRLDRRRIIKPTGPMSRSICIEPYFGARTFHYLGQLANENNYAKELKEQISRFNPELIEYFISNGSLDKIELSDILFSWCEYLDRIHSHDELRTAATGVIDKFVEIVNSKHRPAHIIDALAGLSFAAPLKFIQLEPDFSLRLLRPDEIAEMFSDDIQFGFSGDIEEYCVKTCLDLTCNFAVQFTESADQELDRVPNISEKTKLLLNALHILKPGHAFFFQNTFTFEPSPIPISPPPTSRPVYRQPYGRISLNVEDIDELITLFTALKKCTKNEIKIAVRRLVDAESRISPIDAFLDAMIGLEAILKPNANGDLAFRIALNYAYLAGPSERRSRYEDIKKVQDSRNKIVHAGLNLQPENTSLITEQANVAKACLRDTLKRFLSDDSLRNASKLSAEFWLDRMIPRPPETL